MSKQKLGIGMILAGLTGVVAGLFLSDKPGKTLRKKTSLKLAEIEKFLHDSNKDKKIKEIFGYVDETSSKIFSSMKKDLAKVLSELKTDWKSIDKKKYTKLANGVLQNIKKKQDVSPTIFAKLKKYLAEDYNKFSTPSKKTPSRTKKVSVRKNQ